MTIGKREDYDSSVDFVELPPIDIDDIEIEDEVLRSLENRLKVIPADNRPPLPSMLNKLDEDQAKVVNDKSPVLRVIAPAGAGKTQTITTRVLKLISDGHRPERVLVLTFDRAASAAIRTKLEEERKGISKSTFQVFTLNAYGLRILREHFPEEHRTLINTSSSFAAIKKLLNALKVHKPKVYGLLPSRVRYKFYLELFSFLKNEAVDPRDSQINELARILAESMPAEVFLQNTNTDDERKLVLAALAWAYKSMEKICDDLGVMDFDDQKLKAWRGLRDNPSILDFVQTRLDEIIVDEFQDINVLDFKLIQLLSDNSHLTVTGDDDQAIYGFRGCTPKYIIELEEHLGRKVKSIELRRNYRCPKNIVEHATRLINHNTWRMKKNPIAIREDMAKIKVVSSITAAVECRSAVSFILRTKKSTKELGFNDFAVLYRTNAQSLPIQIQLILRDIPYYVRKEDNILESNVLDRLLSVMRVRFALLDGGEPSDDDAVATFQAFFPWAYTDHVNEFRKHINSSDSVADALLGYTHGFEKYQRIKQFHKAVSDLRKRKNLTDILVEIGSVFTGLQGMIGSLEDVANNDVPLGELLELASSFKNKPRDFVTRLDEAITKAREQGSGSDRENGVALTTYFRAKGLQWHTVLLISCNTGLVPMAKSPVEEERRLFYVGMTRASSNLYISYVKKSCGHLVDPSFFLFEAGLIK